MLIRIRVRLSFYPLSPILIYNITTVSHYLLGGAGIILGYHSWMGNVIRNEPDIEKILTGREPERLSKTRGGVVMS